MSGQRHAPRALTVEKNPGTHWIGDEWSASRPARFNPGKEFRYPLNRRLSGSQRVWTFLGKVKLCCFCRIYQPAALLLCSLRNAGSRSLLCKQFVFLKTPSVPNIILLYVRYRRKNEFVNESEALLEWYWLRKAEIFREKTRLIASVSVINFTWTGMRLNLGLRDEGPATNRLSQGHGPLNIIQYVRPKYRL